MASQSNSSLPQSDHKPSSSLGPSLSSSDLPADPLGLSPPHVLLLGLQADGKAHGLAGDSTIVGGNYDNDEDPPSQSPEGAVPLLPFGTGASKFDRQMVLVKIFYFLVFAGMASLMPFLPVFYASKGYSKTEIGTLQSFQPFVGFIGGTLGPAIADAKNIHRTVLVVALMATLICRTALFPLDSFAPTAVMILVGNLLGSPAFPLIDSSAVDLLGKRSEDYGKIRLWGTIGWGVTAPVVGLLVTKTSLATTFVLHLLFMVPVLALCGRFPIRSSSKKAAPLDLNTVREILKNPAIWSFFATVFFIGHAAGSLTTILFVFLKGLGASEALMGLCLSLNCIAEVPAFFFFNKLLLRIKVRGVLFLSFLCVGARLLYYSFLTNPLLVFPAELLGGAAYAITWSACTYHARELAPKDMGATMQGLLKGVNGIGVGVGSIVAGYVFDHWSATETFRILACVPMGGLTVFLLSNLLLDWAEARKPTTVNSM